MFHLFVDLRTKTKNAVAVGKRSDLPVGLIDIFPTLIDLCKIQAFSNENGLLSLSTPMKRR